MYSTVIRRIQALNLLLPSLHSYCTLQVSHHSAAADPEEMVAR